jgi:hypothetical protein
MTDENEPSPAAESRSLLRGARMAALGSLDRDTGGPHVSLVACATDFCGAPVLLISDLAEHTRNLRADPRASLLIDGTAGYEERLTGPRLTLVGEMRVADAAEVRARYLAHHPSAESYAEFGDFAFWRLALTRAHLVAGFGSIHRIAAAELVDEGDPAPALRAAQAEIIAHLNADHADTLALYAERLCGGSPGAWRALSIDRHGLDMASERERRRLELDAAIATPGEARAAFRRLAERARALRGPATQ